MLGIFHGGRGFTALSVALYITKASDALFFVAPPTLVSQVCESVFELIFAFDEALTSGGYKEGVPMTTIKANLEMESHEEKLHMMIKQSKEDAAKDEMKRQAKAIKERQMQMMKQQLGGPGMGGPPSAGGMQVSVRAVEGVGAPLGGPSLKTPGRRVSNARPQSISPFAVIAYCFPVAGFRGRRRRGRQWGERPLLPYGHAGPVQRRQRAGRRLRVWESWRRLGLLQPVVRHRHSIVGAQAGQVGDEAGGV